MPSPARGAEEMRELVHALRRYAEASDRVVEAAGQEHGLFRTDLRALALLMQRQAEGLQTTPKDLGRLLNLTSASTTALVDRLVANGHARRSRSTTDRRSVIVHHTPQALEDGRAVFAPISEHMMRRLTGFSPEQMRTAAEVIAAATGALDDLDGAGGPAQ
ncbi:MarR family transcriptional regulator [Citricoccus sp. SGAir0253]|uniref:MarR family winged helix-turn-helix transcriptional regulator n=1 Tax=Citricoccus sp. SGAir0253 TaxID=2567881 RepID=UPI0010CCF702|nr:MarR family transcriptional regulator [Citricoccus sp. SGAir0253]QCU77298.1 MarR family transcriptional regulator [Citricoccus sp. SGAir0253]